MSIESLNKKFDKPFQNCIIIDFVIDTDDARKVFNSKLCDQKFNFDKPNLKMNIIKIDGDPHHRISSFTLSEDEFSEDNLEQMGQSWELIEKIEIDNCQVLILSEDNLNSDIDEWLESCFKMNQLYHVEEDGRICLISGFGPGVYRLMGVKNDNKYIACKMEFIKEVI